MKRIVSLLAAIIVLSVAFATPAAAATPRPGEILPDIPKLTVRHDVSITENSKIQDGEFTMAWEAHPGAEKYSVRVFFNIYIIEKKKGIELMFREEYVTEDTEVTVSGLIPDSRYTVIVYALNAQGEEIATYDRMPVGTIEGFGMHSEEESFEEILDEPKKTEKEGFSLTIIVVIAAAAFVVIVAVTVMVIVLSMDKKKLSKSE